MEENKQEVKAGEEAPPEDAGKKQKKKTKGRHYTLQVQSPIMGAISKKGR